MEMELHPAIGHRRSLDTGRLRIRFLQNGDAAHSTGAVGRDNCAKTGMSLGQPAPMKPSDAVYITLLHPAAMSAQVNDIYQLDAGLRRIFRYDRGQQLLTPFVSTP